MAESDNQAPFGRSTTTTVLLAEDESMVRELITQFLGNLGYRVLGAKDGPELLDLYRRHKEENIQLLITDLVMPRMGGVELAAAMRRSQPDLRVLFISGYTDDVVILEGEMGKGTAFLKKPFNFETLKSKVAEMTS